MYLRLPRVVAPLRYGAWKHRLTAPAGPEISTLFAPVAANKKQTDSETVFQPLTAQRAVPRCRCEVTDHWEFRGRDEAPDDPVHVVASNLIGTRTRRGPRLIMASFPGLRVVDGCPDRTNRVPESPTSLP